MALLASLFTSAATAGHDLRYSAAIDQLKNLARTKDVDCHDVFVAALDLLVHQGKHYCAFALLCQSLASSFAGVLQALETYHMALLAGKAYSWDMRTVPEATVLLDRALAKKCVHFKLTHSFTLLNAIYDRSNYAWRNDSRIQFLAAQIARACRRITNDVEEYYSTPFERLAKIINFVRHE